MTRKELLAQAKPLLEKFDRDLIGVRANVGLTALATMTVIVWKKTGLPLKFLHDFIDQLASESKLMDN